VQKYHSEVTLAALLTFALALGAVHGKVSADQMSMLTAEPGGGLAESLRRLAEEAERLQQKYGDSFDLPEDGDTWDDADGHGILPGMAAWMEISAWTANFSIRRSEDSETEAPRFRNTTTQRWSATGTVTLTKPADRPVLGGEMWEGRDPVAVRMRETGVTEGQDDRGAWFTLQAREVTGDGHTDGDLMMTIDAYNGTYSVTFGVAAFEVEEVVQHGTGQAETRRREAYHFSPAVTDQPLPPEPGELSGSTEQTRGNRVVLIEWTLTPSGQTVTAP
jgi:hypothetical protein